MMATGADLIGSHVIVHFGDVQTNEAIIEGFDPEVGYYVTNVDCEPDDGTFGIWVEALDWPNERLWIETMPGGDF